MQNKPLKILFLLLLGITTLCYLLVRSAQLPNERPNGFVRNWIPHALKPLKNTTFSFPLEKINGFTQHNIFFSVPNPKWFIMMDLSFDNQDTVGFGVQVDENILSMNTTIVDSPNVYLFANNVPAFYKGTLGRREIDFLPLKSAFTRSDRISSDLIVLRTIDSNLSKQVFQTVGIKSGLITNQAEIITNQKPGGFESDGWLKFDPHTKRIYFVEYYRNKFYCIDTSLKLQYVGNTIDTINTNQMEVKPITIDNKKLLMPATPRIRVNKDCFIGKEYLFINSKLKADNEKISDFKNNIVIDAYRLSDGLYKGSFYIPCLKTEKPKSIELIGNQLIVLFDKYISTFVFKI